MRREPGPRNPPPRTTKAAPAAEPLFLVRRKRFAFSPGLGPRVDGSLVRFGESVVSPTRAGGQPPQESFLESRDIPVTGPGTGRCEAAWLRQGWGQAL